MRQPGGVATAHRDTFARDHLPPRELWPRMDYSVLPELDAYPERLNAAVELLDRWVEAGHGDRRALSYGELVWSYATLRDRVDRIARVLTEDLGLIAGQRVLLRSANNPMLAAAWLAVLKAGGICVSTMPLLRARELAVMIERARVDLALCESSLVHELELARQRGQGPRSIACFSPAGSGAAELDRLIAGRAPDFAAVASAADDVALIAFTSGTTGSPKGTVHFHRDVLAMCDTFARHVFQVAPSDVFLGTPPLAFTFGLGALLCFPLRFGASVVFPTERPTAELLVETIERHRCTALFTAPTMYRALSDLPRRRLPSLAKCVSAGEPLPAAVFETFRAATGIRIMDGLGTTEMMHIFVSAAGAAIRAGATGTAVPGYALQVTDERGHRLPPGELGLLAVRGPTGCRYLDDPERQRSYVRDGWNVPGDLVRLDHDGYVWYQSRADDLIVSAGYNIAGPEVETVLLDHPKVKECAVVGAPDPQRGQIVKAFVVLRDPRAAGPATVEELQAYVKGELAAYKYPRAIAFLDQLPRTETGKIQRYKLRQQS